MGSGIWQIFFHMVYYLQSNLIPLAGQSICIVRLSCALNAFLSQIKKKFYQIQYIS